MNDLPQAEATQKTNKNTKKARHIFLKNKKYFLTIFTVPCLQQQKVAFIFKNVLNEFNYI